MSLTDKKRARQWLREYRALFFRLGRYMAGEFSLNEFKTLLQTADIETLEKIVYERHKEQEKRKYLNRIRKNTQNNSGHISLSLEFSRPDVALEYIERAVKGNPHSSVMGVTFCNSLPKTQTTVLAYNPKLKIYKEKPIKKNKGCWKVVEFKNGKVQKIVYYARKQGAEEHAKRFYGL